MSILEITLSVALLLAGALIGLLVWGVRLQREFVGAQRSRIDFLEGQNDKLSTIVSLQERINERDKEGLDRLARARRNARARRKLKKVHSHIRGYDSLAGERAEIREAINLLERE